MSDAQEPLRCKGKQHAVLLDQNTVEIKCDSRVCGAGPGVVVLHQWNLTTMEMETKRYRSPAPQTAESR